MEYPADPAVRAACVRARAAAVEVLWALAALGLAALLALGPRW